MKRKKVLAAIFIPLAILAILLAAAVAYYFIATAGVRLDPEKLSLKIDCIRIYDAAGNEMETESRQSTPYSEFPDHLPHAFVAVEDKRFYTHNGFDVKRIGKALLKNLRALSFREGASTISQQLIKNTHLTSEKTLTRKLKEFRLTRRLERKYTKEEIMALYLNSIYFGHSAFGIGDAARFYFGKTPDELQPAESALLAALVKSPNRYSPFKDPEKCLARRNFVLSLMLEQGYLSQTEYDEAVVQPLPESPVKTRGNAYCALVFEELADLFPDARSGEMGELRVYTAYDAELQETLEGIEAPSDVVALVRDNKTDAIKALRASAGIPKRSPASTIKPLLVYAPAIEENLVSPATPMLDARTDFAGYCPDDAGGATGSYMSVRYALAHSVNIPAVKLLNTLGVERGAKYLNVMRLTVDPADYSLALALGGMREGFTLPALADGYATLANGGNFAPSGTIVRIENNKRTIYRRPANKTRVFSEETAFLVNDMLATAATEGTARKLKSLPFPVCAKTGTAEGAAGNLDAYTIAYTSEDVVAVWLGNRDNSPVSATGGGLPANFARDILLALYKGRTPAAFLPPQGVEKLSFDKRAYESEHRILRSDPNAPLYLDPSDYFKCDFEPKEQCTRYTAPTISEPSVSVKNGVVSIILCQAEYYDYVVKRENRGEITTVYSGKYKQVICDNSVKAGESYLYTVVPVYRGTEGVAVTLPRVYIRADDSYGDWWEE